MGGGQECTVFHRSDTKLLPGSICYRILCPCVIAHLRLQCCSYAYFFFAIFELKSRHLQCELFGIPGHFEECTLTHQGKIKTSWRNKSCSLWIRTWRETHQSEVVMNPKQVFLSVLLFGAAGLLLFMYLQVWIEEQHTGNVQTYGLPLNENCNGNLLLRKWWSWQLYGKPGTIQHPQLKCLALKRSKYFKYFTVQWPFALCLFWSLCHFKGDPPGFISTTSVSFSQTAHRSIVLIPSLICPPTGTKPK